MQEKEPIMVVRCKLKLPSLRMTVRHHSASLAMLNSYRRERIFNQQLIAIKKSYNKVCNCVMFEHLLHTNMRYFCPYLCYIRKCNMAEPMLHTKIWYLSVSALFFYIWKCVMSFSVLLFFQNLDRCISKCSKSWEGQIHLFLRFGPRHSLYWWWMTFGNPSV